MRRGVAQPRPGAPHCPRVPLKRSAQGFRDCRRRYRYPAQHRGRYHYRHPSGKRGGRSPSHCLLHCGSGSPLNRGRSCRRNRARGCWAWSCGSAGKTLVSRHPSPARRTRIPPVTDLILSPYCLERTVWLNCLVVFAFSRVYMVV